MEVVKHGYSMVLCVETAKLESGQKFIPFSFCLNHNFGVPNENSNMLLVPFFLLLLARLGA